MWAVRIYEANDPGGIPKRYQVLTKKSHPQGRSVRLWELLRQSCWDPVAPEQLARRSSRPYPSEAFIVGSFHWSNFLLWGTREHFLHNQAKGRQPVAPIGSATLHSWDVNGSEVEGSWSEQLLDLDNSIRETLLVDKSRDCLQDLARSMVKIGRPTNRRSPRAVDMKNEDIDISETSNSANLSCRQNISEGWTTVGSSLIPCG